MIVYVDDLNIISTSDATSEIVSQLKGEFEMKVLGKTTFRLGLLVEHLAGSIILHQTLYTRKLVKRFSMDVAHPLGSPVVVHTLDLKNDEFRPCDKGGGGTCLEHETPYLTTISALMYLANCTRSDIAFVG